MEITTDQLQVQSSGDQPLQIQSANQQLQIQSANQLQIHPNAIVMKDANLQRKIKIGLGTVVHPKASIDAGRGAIEFGSYNIVEEGALIQNKGDSESLMSIGNDNLFETNSTCNAKSIGNSNVFGVGSIVGPSTTVTDGCRIGAKCTVAVQTVLPQTVIQFADNRTFISREEQISQKTQAEYLKKLLPKYSYSIKGTWNEPL